MIPLHEVAEAMEASAGTFGEEQRYYLDLREEKVLLIPDEVLTPLEDGDEESLADLPDWEQELVGPARLIVEDAQEVRFKPIPPVESHEAFEIMEMFIQQLQDQAVREKLATAITRRRPFRSFKDALYEFPEVQKEWFSFQDEARCQIARQWLEGIGVKPENIAEPTGPGKQPKEQPDDEEEQ